MRNFTTSSSQSRRRFHHRDQTWPCNSQSQPRTVLNQSEQTQLKHHFSVRPLAMPSDRLETQMSQLLEDFSIAEMAQSGLSRAGLARSTRQCSARTRSTHANEEGRQNVAAILGYEQHYDSSFATVGRFYGHLIATLSSSKQGSRQTQDIFHIFI